MKGSAITGPVGKEAAELWPVCKHPSNLKGSKLTPSSVLRAILAWWCKTLDYEVESPNHQTKRIIPVEDLIMISSSPQ